MKENITHSPTVDSSEITIEVDGVYNAHAAIQGFQAGGGGGAVVSVWFQHNLAAGGGWIDEKSAVTRTMTSNSAGFYAATHTDRYLEGDRIRLMWATDNLNGQLTSFAASSPVPLVTSIAFNITNIVAI